MFHPNKISHLISKISVSDPMGRIKVSAPYFIYDDGVRIKQYIYWQYYTLEGSLRSQFTMFFSDGLTKAYFSKYD